MVSPAHPEETELQPSASGGRLTGESASRCTCVHVVE